MRKILSLLLALALLTGAWTVDVFAAEDPSFHFELTVDGRQTKQVQEGDIITVTVRLKRTDAEDPYSMYAMQDEIRYDANYFTLVEESVILNTGIASTNIAVQDDYQELYMNYLCTSGGEEWKADTLLGSFQLKVIASSGTTQITSQDYLVSTQDGSGSFPCTANELTIMLDTEESVNTEDSDQTTQPTVSPDEKPEKSENPDKNGSLLWILIALGILLLLLILLWLLLSKKKSSDSES